MDEAESKCKEIKSSCLGTKERTFSKSFQVVIRICPQEQKHDESKRSLKVQEPNRLIIDTGRGHQPHMMEFDAIWDENASQRDVYESTAKPLVALALQGYNGCVITYGSPSSGKTFTMQGGGLSGKQRGIIARAAEDIFQKAVNLHYRIRASFIHISNEKIYDLLDINHAEVNRIHETEESILLEGLTEIEVSSPESLLQLYRRGVSKSDFARRSHTIFNIIVDHTKVDTANAKERTMTSRLTLVELASCGRVSGHRAFDEGRRSFQTMHENPQELKSLKRSITIFGNVIFALSTPGCQHIPYRESKLTRVLRDCLGGNYLTSLIVTISSDISSVHETLSMLQFASRAMSVPNRSVKTAYTQTCVLQANTSKQNEKGKASQGQPLMGFQFLSDKKVLQIQTCLPPIHFCPSPSSVSIDKRPNESLQKQEESRDSREMKISLPLLEKTNDKVYYISRVPPLLEKNKAMEGQARDLQSPPSCLGGHMEPGREKQLSPRVTSEKIHDECMNCKKERKIREEYDKYLLQLKRDKDSLQDKIINLEAELRRCKEEKQVIATSREGLEMEEIHRLKGKVEMYKTKMSHMVDKSELSKLIEENKTKQQTIDDLLHETELNKTQLQKAMDKENILLQRLKEEQQKTASEAKDYRCQFDKMKEAEKQRLRQLENEKEVALLELKASKLELERFKDEIRVIVGGLQREKERLFMDMEDARNLRDMLKTANDALLARICVLEQQLCSQKCSSCQFLPGHPLPFSGHPKDAEMLLISQDQGPAASRKKSVESPSTLQSESTEAHFVRDYEIMKMKDMLKQVKREHTLLLDMMVIMFTRKWFVEEAVPHIKRTLKKCGMRLEDTD
ncbi:kinesin-like protein Klp68D isoform X2 [Polypterus senegalus]|uniref:kinesin-like protein Klp68D isoform X2 n=1 Tax=Polypterus senegalus TaxID=55291 RepID=UPI001965C93B|nr:kinesin-like protein Klp68D isoform X2 [Polypterus senegalus]